MLSDNEKAFVYANRVLIKLINAGAPEITHLEIFHDGSCRLILPKNIPSKITELATELLYSVRVESIPMFAKTEQEITDLGISSCGGLHVGAKSEKDLLDL